MEKDLKIIIKKIKGTCPVFNENEQFFIRKGYILESVSQKICMHALSSLMPFYSILGLENVKPEMLELGKEGKAYIQCLDPCEYTNGGTVIFEIEKV